MNPTTFPSEFERYLDRLIERHFEDPFDEYFDELHRGPHEEPFLSERPEGFLATGLWTEEMGRPGGLGPDTVFESGRETLANLLLVGDDTVVMVSPDDYPYISEFDWHRGSHGAGKVYVYRYKTGKAGKRKIYLHRVIAGARNGQKVDHKNGDTLDNRRCNLRITTSRGNAQNRRKARSYKKKATSSPFKGVYWDKVRDRYRARIWKDGKQHHLGYHVDPFQAARAYDRAAAEMFEVPRLNFGPAGHPVGADERVAE